MVDVNVSDLIVDSPRCMWVTGSWQGVADEISNAIHQIRLIGQHGFPIP